MEKITVRDVGNQQVYDSYMGILRISPNLDDDNQTKYIDDAKLFLTNPKKPKDNANSDGTKEFFIDPKTKENINKGNRKIILSDSDGITLGAYFSPRVKETVVVNDLGLKEKQNIINITFNVEDGSTLYLTQSLNVKSTLFVSSNVKKQSESYRIAPIQIYSKLIDGGMQSGAWHVVAYPVESPNDDEYFNNRNKLELIDYTDPTPVHDQLEEALYKKSVRWYDENIDVKHKVKIAGKVIYTTNEDYDAVPILYTRDYVLGSYSGHTQRFSDQIKGNYLYGDMGEEWRYKLQTDDNSFVTRLSFIRFDDVVWECLQEALTGEIRHQEGRYQELGLHNKDNMLIQLFGDYVPYLSKTAPLLGQGVSPGIVMYNAMPFKRFAFHQMRQLMRNAEDEAMEKVEIDGDIKSQVNVTKLEPVLKRLSATGTNTNYIKYYNEGRITAIKKKDPGFINNLTKEFVLCDGKELNYANYPFVNTDNDKMFEVNDSGIANRDDNGKPIEKTLGETEGDVYQAIKESNKDKKLIVPHLLDIDNLQMRYIRGLNWLVEAKTEDFPFNAQSSANFGTSESTGLVFKQNNNKIQLFNDENLDDAAKEWGMVEKNFYTVGNYRMNVDFKLPKSRHTHKCFYNSNSNNRNAANTRSAGSIMYSTKNTIDDWRTAIKSRTKPLLGSWLKNVRASVPGKTQFQQMYRPNSWNMAEMEAVDQSGKNELYEKKTDTDMITNYSFWKQNVQDGKRRPNSFEGHTPVKCGALYAWKLDKNGKMTNADYHQADINSGDYVIPALDKNGNAGIAIGKTEAARKKQLELMNAVEGRIPIANKGGSELAETEHQYVWCRKRKPATFSFQYNYHKNTFWGYNGGYELASAVEFDDENIPNNYKEYPRCITSLPIADVNDIIEDKEPEEPETVTIGGIKTEVNSTVSNPPSINLLPLFKI